jgi:hypothetical protein
MWVTVTVINLHILINLRRNRTRRLLSVNTASIFIANIARSTAICVMRVTVTLINLHIQLNFPKIMKINSYDSIAGVFRCLLAELCMKLSEYMWNSLRNFHKERFLTGSRSMGHVFHCLLDLN